ncbi:MAG TPA: type 2 isopentenyl-diphosphate Delta-isomerase [Thermoplasmatales archaeon]|nr:type 2 isopentenyl-diphosphate Delta-isomerase [Thermoplasmatales archaeon]
MNGRKKDHIEISKNEDVASTYNYWDDIGFVHNALPEVDMDDIDLTWQEFGKTMQAPLIIAGMTGGFEEATQVNRYLASLAQQFQIGMGVGSQRVALENGGAVDSYAVITEYDIPLTIANLGAPQLLEWADAAERAAQAVDMIEADVLAIHLNFLQECIQIEGDRKARGVLDKIQEVAASLTTPVIVKETGAGISGEVARRLCQTDIVGIDVGGMSGTSFAAIEAYRAQKTGETVQESLGYLFRDWGIPTPLSVMEVVEACRDTGMTVIATGGIRNGLDVARALALGADAAGMAAVLLTNDAEQALHTTIQALRTVMFLTGCRSLQDLREVDLWIG